jgi:SAM-dependent methyltransferase
MAYYDSIAQKWHQITSRSGGAFKRYVLNDSVLAEVGSVDGQAILDLGAGNGYFMPLLLRRCCGQVPTRIVITDQSQALLTIARRHFRVPNAQYIPLDVRSPFPFEQGSFDVILAIMVFNELTDGALRRALSECRRVVSETGRLVGAVAHPSFVRSLSRRGLLERKDRGPQTMPGTGGLRLPVVERSQRRYESLFEHARWQCQWKDIAASQDVLNAKPGLRRAGRVPLARLFTCTPCTPPQSSSKGDTH